MFGRRDILTMVLGKNEHCERARAGSWAFNWQSTWNEPHMRLTIPLAEFEKYI